MSGYRHLAEVYEHLADDVLHALYKQLIHRHSKPCTVLEVGCGTAALSRDLAREGYRVSGMDVSLEMLNMAGYYAGMEQVDLTLFHHDARQPFDGQYDLVLMPVDVVNHFASFQEIETVFKHVHHVLSPQGTLIFDYLHIEYMTALIGHEETVQVGDHVVHWRVEAADIPAAHRHVVTCDGATASHISRSYIEARWASLYAPYEVLETVHLEHRNMVVLRKR
ncbi:MAG: class I SAM-dependent methyltransferase [Acholeplasmatales bacterium]|nr:MAG: class I SAM-dependent methyltransferase [Acholeplasmatales bacterium]